MLELCKNYCHLELEDHLEVVYDDTACTMTAVFNVRGGILSMYARHLVKPLVPAGSIEYWVTQIVDFFCHGSLARTRFDKEPTHFKMLGIGQAKKKEKFIAAANLAIITDPQQVSYVRSDSPPTTTC